MPPSSAPRPHTGTYLVGGAVRDALLGLTVKDRDWVVVGSSPQQMLDAGFVAVGKDFPDRKSTRLNSSHGYISYAVFCL